MHLNSRIFRWQNCYRQRKSRIVSFLLIKPFVDFVATNFSAPVCLSLTLPFKPDISTDILYKPTVIWNKSSLLRFISKVSLSWARQSKWFEPSFTGAQLNFYPRFMSLAVFPQKITLKEARMDNPRFGPPFHKRKEPSWKQRSNYPPLNV